MDLRVGVIGFGHRGQLAHDAHHPGAGSYIAAVCDVSERSRQQAGDQFPDALVTGSLDELLATDLDAVMVLTPDGQHAETVIPALEAGLAVFCEKPMAISIDDCDRMLEAAYRTRSRLYLGHNMRHLPMVRLMHDLITDGRIGEVKAVWCRHFVGNGGDWYFKDWHADRSKSLGLLLQKGAHDIDVIHLFAGGYSTQVQAIGALSVYGDIEDRRDRSGERMDEWLSVDNWPPTAATGLNPVIDVEDISQMNMILDNGVLASYQQCHFTPDNWRNYTVIGTAGRIENVGGNGAGAQVHLWNRRRGGFSPPDEIFIVPEGQGGHAGADRPLVAEFLSFARDGGVTLTSPVAARNSVAAGVMATASLRGDRGAVVVPPLRSEVADYFAAGQPGSSGVRVRERAGGSADDI